MSDPSRQTRIELIARSVIAGCVDVIPPDATIREVSDAIALANRLRWEEMERDKRADEDLDR